MESLQNVFGTLSLLFLSFTKQLCSANIYIHYSNNHVVDFLVRIAHNFAYLNLSAVLGEFLCGFSVFAEISSGFAVFAEISSGFAVLGTPLTPPRIFYFFQSSRKNVKISRIKKYQHFFQSPLCYTIYRKIYKTNPQIF